MKDVIDIQDNAEHLNHTASSNRRDNDQSKAKIKVSLFNVVAFNLFIYLLAF